MTDKQKSPLVEYAEHFDDVFWHALNYRTAGPRQADAMWDELESCINRKVAAERERCAKMCEKYAEGIPDGCDDGARMCAAMLRRDAALRL
jgi:hypothetical protein